MTSAFPDCALEQSFAGPVVGVDEVGCGPWAGPVVAAAVSWRTPEVAAAFVGRINDSKAVSTPGVLIGVGMVSVEDIDRLNIRQATFLAMQRAVQQLPIVPRVILVDGTGRPHFGENIHVVPVVKGDTKSLAIAAASIVAKETRDALMQQLSQNFPMYGWERNAGYGTRAHQAALVKYGVTPHHRRSFAPIARLLD
jgi:ribonuclease HII